MHMGQSCPCEADEKAFRKSVSVSLCLCVLLSLTVSVPRPVSDALCLLISDPNPFVLPWLHLCLLSLHLTKSAHKVDMALPQHAQCRTRTGGAQQNFQNEEGRLPESGSQAVAATGVQPEVPMAGSGLWSRGAFTLALGGHQPLPPCRRQEAWAAAGRTGCAPPLGRPGRHLALAGAADAAHLARTPARLPPALPAMDGPQPPALWGAYENRISEIR